MAWNGQLLSHAPHLIHFSASITNGSLIFPLIAPTGQLRAHFEHPLHNSGLLLNLRNALHVPDAHFLSITCSIYY